jgi:hypothetical protein
MIHDDIQIEDEACPQCGAYEVRSRLCDQAYCDDGWCDEHESDPINFSPGEEYSMCNECLGTGILRWCSGCGFDITRYEYTTHASTED